MAPEVGEPIPVDEIECLARAHGVCGEALLDVILDVLAFDEAWLRIEYRRLKERLDDMNRR